MGRLFSETDIRSSTFLELGAGPGLPSLYLALRGARATVTDKEKLGVSLFESSARLNGLSTWRAQVLDWQDAQTTEAVKQLGLKPPYNYVIAAMGSKPESPWQKWFMCTAWASMNETSKLIIVTQSAIVGERLGERAATPEHVSRLRNKFLECFWEHREVTSAIALNFTPLDVADAYLWVLRRKNWCACPGSSE